MEASSDSEISPMHQQLEQNVLAPGEDHSTAGSPIRAPKRPCPADDLKNENMAILFKLEGFPTAASTPKPKKRKTLIRCAPFRLVESKADDQSDDPDRTLLETPDPEKDMPPIIVPPYGYPPMPVPDMSPPRPVCKRAANTSAHASEKVEVSVSFLQELVDSRWVAQDARYRAERRLLQLMRERKDSAGS
ncbi:hypothetical protein HYDPIDRAFT_29003 [Hydnomerulius pinastri MD-312]|uniref:Uncharacterized protein n=1 Tax=Hydnomerulius pinastri MD-312 TaxID=994086 RepID=A0A0C9W062_9AGAM|nr:hypothetical protein HYDPIDRAFT_29003 [Hydnomerulius pinastri MD-312]